MDWFSVLKKILLQIYWPDAGRLSYSGQQSAVNIQGPYHIVFAG